VLFLLSLENQKTVLSVKMQENARPIVAEAPTGPDHAEGAYSAPQTHSWWREGPAAPPRSRLFGLRFNPLVLADTTAQFIYTSLFARKAAETSEKKHQTHNNNKKHKKPLSKRAN